MFNKIQTRITLLLLLISAIFIIGLLQLTNSEKDKFETLLKERTKEKEELVCRVISTLGENLRTFTYDYSYWDDMLKFLSTGDSGWAYVNIESVLPTFKAYGAWVYNKDLKLVYSTDTLKSKGLHEFPLEKEKLKVIFKGNWFPYFFINTEAGILEVRGAPIQPSADLARQTTPKGFLISCRLWDKKYLNELAALSASDSTELIAVGSKENTWKNNNPEQIIYTSQKVLKSWNGEPVGIFKSRTKFPMMGEVLRRGRTEFWINIAFAFVILLAISLFLLRYVIRPLKKISGSIEEQDSVIIQSLLEDKSEFGKLSTLIDHFFRQKNDLVREIEERKTVQTELQEKVTTLQLLKALHNAFQRALDLKQIYDLVYDIIPLYFGSRGIHRASLMVYEPKTNSLISDKLLDNYYSKEIELS
ncbi:MAG: CHASE4 domain-containing protein, partial [Bacillota bacterium]